MDHICPHLGLANDPSCVALFACDAHCCAVHRGKLAATWQQQYCLNVLHLDCPHFPLTGRAPEAFAAAQGAQSSRDLRRPLTASAMIVVLGLNLSVAAGFVLQSGDGSAQGLSQATQPARGTSVALLPTQPEDAPSTANRANLTVTPASPTPPTTQPSPSPTATKPAPTSTPRTTATPTATIPAPSPTEVSTPLPAPTTSPAPSAAPTETMTLADGSHAVLHIHIVADGETLASIAALYGVTAFEIASQNDLADINVIHVGQPLRIVVPLE
jgi:LysM repeat protein